MAKKKVTPWEEPGFEDSPELTAEDFARMRPIQEVVPGAIEAFERARRGRPPVENKKEHVSLRIAPDVLKAYRSLGPGWQAEINKTLARGAAKLKKAAPAKRRRAARVA